MLVNLFLSNMDGSIGKNALVSKPRFKRDPSLLGVVSDQATQRNSASQRREGDEPRVFRHPERSKQ
jgi:hypothetical protein